MPLTAWMTHAELVAEVRDLCAPLGVLFIYHPDSRLATERGWPDASILGNGALFRELKTTRDDLTPEQRKIGSWLTSAGLDWAVWRPRDLFDGTIERQLKRISERT